MSQTSAAPAEQAMRGTTPDDSGPAHVRPDDAPLLPAPLDDRPAFLVRDAPLIDTIPDRWIAYLHATVAIAEDPKQHPITRAEIGMFIELCARYMLDPFAKEAWLAKSKRGKLLTMVGRDGLRKIAQRNALHIDGDVVHEGDSFEVSRTPDGNRTVSHSYKITEDRGKILGAWAEVREGGPLGRPMGFFWAPLGEYKPSGASEWSVWSKQTSVMILGAAERTAIRQATPLGGLVAFGEHESAFARQTLGEGTGDGQPSDVPLPPEVAAVIKRATELGHAGLADLGAMHMQVDGQPAEYVARKVAEWSRELDEIPADAEIVTAEPEARESDLRPEGAQASNPTPQAGSGPQAPPQAAEAPKSWDSAKAAPTAEEQRVADTLGVAIESQGFLDDGPPRRAEPRTPRDPDAIERMRAQALELLAFADAMDAEDNADAAEKARGDASDLMAEVDAASDPDQIGLEL